MTSIYIAGPLFTPAQRQTIDELAIELRLAGHTCFVPHENVLADNDPDAIAIYETDMEGLRSADLMVAIVDGSDVDSGTAAEIGVFAAWDRRVIAFTTDFRVTRLGITNKFIEGLILSEGGIRTTMTQILNAIEAPTSGPR